MKIAYVAICREVNVRSSSGRRGMVEDKDLLRLKQADVAFDVAWSVAALPAIFIDAAFSSPAQIPAPIFIQAAENAIKRFSILNKIRFIRSKYRTDYKQFSVKLVHVLEELRNWLLSREQEEFRDLFEDWKEQFEQGREDKKRFLREQVTRSVPNATTITLPFVVPELDKTVSTPSSPTKEVALVSAATPVEIPELNETGSALSSPTNEISLVRETPPVVVSEFNNTLNVPYTPTREISLFSELEEVCDAITRMLSRCPKTYARPVKFGLYMGELLAALAYESAGIRDQNVLGSVKAAIGAAEVLSAPSKTVTTNAIIHCENAYKTSRISTFLLPELWSVFKIAAEALKSGIPLKIDSKPSTNDSGVDQKKTAIPSKVGRQEPQKRKPGRPKPSPKTVRLRQKIHAMRLRGKKFDAIASEFQINIDEVKAAFNAHRGTLRREKLRAQNTRTK